MQCARGLHQDEGPPRASPEGFLLPFQSPFPKLSPPFRQKLHKRGHAGSPLGQEAARTWATVCHAGTCSAGRAGRKNLPLPATCLASAVLREQLLFRNWLLFIKKRNHLNDGKQKLPKPYFLPFYVLVIVVALPWSVRDARSSPRSLAALPGQGTGGVKEGFCTQLSSLSSSKQLMVRAKWAFGGFCCLYGPLVPMLQKVDCFKT